MLCDAWGRIFTGGFNCDIAYDDQDPVYVTGISNLNFTGSYDTVEGRANVTYTVQHQLINTLIYKSYTTFTFDSSNPRGLTVDIDLENNTLPVLSMGWYPIQITHLFWDVDHNHYETGVADAFHIEYNGTYPNGRLVGNYTLTNNSLTDGTTYRDDLMITWKKINGDETATWLP